MEGLPAELERTILVCLGQTDRVLAKSTEGSLDRDLDPDLDMPDSSSTKHRSTIPRQFEGLSSLKADFVAHHVVCARLILLTGSQA